MTIENKSQIQVKISFKVNSTHFLCSFCISVINRNQKIRIKKEKKEICDMN